MAKTQVSYVAAQRGRENLQKWSNILREFVESRYFCTKSMKIAKRTMEKSIQTYTWTHHIVPFLHMKLFQLLHGCWPHIWAVRTRSINIMYTLFIIIFICGMIPFLRVLFFSLCSSFRLATLSFHFATMLWKCLYIIYMYKPSVSLEKSSRHETHWLFPFRIIHSRGNFVKWTDLQWWNCVCLHRIWFIL